MSSAGARIGLAGTRAEVWTFCLVNRSDKPKTVRVRVPEAKPGTFKHYLYSRDKAAADKDGFPVPVEETPGDLVAEPLGIELVDCPGLKDRWGAER